MLLPTLYSSVVPTYDKQVSDEQVLVMSRWSSILMLFLYAQYLYFQLITHSELFEEEKKPLIDAITGLQVVDPVSLEPQFEEGEEDEADFGFWGALV